MTVTRPPEAGSSGNDPGRTRGPSRCTGWNAAPAVVAHASAASPTGITKARRTNGQGN
jgi:hypothetical protein